MLNLFQVVIMFFSTPLTLVWLYFAAFHGKKYQEYTDSVFAREFQMSDLFCVGFSVMSLLRMDTRNRRAQAKIKEIAEIRGKKYAEYYYYIMQGAKITYAYTIFVIAFLLAALANSVEALLLGIVLGVLAVAYIDLSLKDKLTERHQEILMDLPQVLSKLTLLVNSGMVLREAWTKTALTGKRVLYQEMQNTSIEMENGVMEIEAYKNFADRCSVKETRKFASLIIQNIQKGNEELAFFLKDMSDEMWEMKKNQVKQKGEAANSKLLFPVLLIFIGILVLILVPILTGIG